MNIFIQKTINNFLDQQAKEEPKTRDIFSIDKV